MATLLGILVVLVYLVPTVAAYSRRHPHRLQIALLNVFLGWTFVGWVAALVWAASPTE